MEHQASEEEYQVTLDLLGLEGNMIEIRQNSDGEIGIGMHHSIFGFIPVLTFSHLGKFRKFIDALERYYSEQHPEIPDVFLQAFSEEEHNS